MIDEASGFFAEQAQHIVFDCRMANDPAMMSSTNPARAEEQQNICLQ
jgi:hypothetical protein